MLQMKNHGTYKNMKNQKRIIREGLLVCGVILGCMTVFPAIGHLWTEYAVAATSGNNSQNPTTSKTVCLACHKPFDDLTKKTVKFTMPSKEVTSPHLYVPHESKEMKDIPECTGCHEAHALPAPTSRDRSRISVDFCYSCHHEKTLARCAECHGATKVQAR